MSTTVKPGPDKLSALPLATQVGYVWANNAQVLNSNFGAAKPTRAELRAALSAVFTGVPSAVPVTRPVYDAIYRQWRWEMYSVFGGGAQPLYRPFVGAVVRFLPHIGQNIRLTTVSVQTWTGHVDAPDGVLCHDVDVAIEDSSKPTVLYILHAAFRNGVPSLFIDDASWGRVSAAPNMCTGLMVTSKAAVTIGNMTIQIMPLCRQTRAFTALLYAALRAKSQPEERRTDA